jgi:hypothetical protein
MGKVRDAYYEEKLDILDTLDKLNPPISVRLLNVWVNEPQGFENAKYILELNANRKFDWFSRDMVKELLEEETYET